MGGSRSDKMIHHACSMWNSRSVSHRWLRARHLVPAAHSHSGCATQQKFDQTPEQGGLSSMGRSRSDKMIHRAHSMWRKGSEGNRTLTVSHLMSAAHSHSGCARRHCSSDVKATS